MIRMRFVSFLIRLICDYTFYLSRERRRKKTFCERVILMFTMTTKLISVSFDVFSAKFNRIHLAIFQNCMCFWFCFEMLIHLSLPISCSPCHSQFDPYTKRPRAYKCNLSKIPTYSCCCNINITIFPMATTTASVARTRYTTHITHKTVMNA